MAALLIPTAPDPHRAFQARQWMWGLGVILALWAGMIAGAPEAEISGSVCRASDGELSTLLDSRLEDSIAADLDTVRALVRKLQQDFDLPLSFIEHRADESLVLPPAALSLEELLQAVVDQHDHYRCETAAGRLVLRSSDATFDVVISGVDVVEETRLQALYTYIRHLRAFDKRFENWNTPLIAWSGAGPPPVFTDRVTLSPRASVFQHLIQLLGRNHTVYFDVPAPGPSAMPWRTIDLGAVRHPWERIPRIAPAPPADVTGKKQ